MKWRTDKPTADVIVAYVWKSPAKETSGPCILYLAKQPYEYYYDNGGYMVAYGAIEKWADLEGGETETDITIAANMLLDALSKTPFNNRPITDTQIIVKQLLVFLNNPASYNPNAINEKEDETVTDCYQYSAVEEELDAFIKSGKAIKEENCGNYTTTYIDPLKVARHFAKWGAEHLKNKQK